MPVSQFEVFEVLGVQVAPSFEVTIVPASPTATKESFPYAIEVSSFCIPDALRVQFVPFSEVRIVPPAPIATKEPCP
jgi:hypothetical protein